MAAPVESEPELGSPVPSERTDPRHQQFLRYDCTSGDTAQVAEAAKAARLSVARGECIVLPTDTVYGIGADVFNADAVQRLLDAKERGRDMPPPVLIAEPSLIRVLAVDVPQAAHDLVARHWPGPLTIICQAQPSLRIDLGEAEGTIALRVPDHRLAREVLRQTGPLAVSSANISGQPAAVSCDEAVEQLGNRVAVYLDGGELAAAQRLPSTMVDFSRSEAGELLRHGGVSVEVLRETCPDLVDVSPDRPTDAGSTDEGLADAGYKEPSRNGSHAVDLTEPDPAEPPSGA